MAYAASLSAGFDRAAYDLNVMFIPQCSSQGFSGIGWVGVPGALQNSGLNDYDASVAHELVKHPNPPLTVFQRSDLVRVVRGTTWVRTTRALSRPGPGVPKRSVTWTPSPPSPTG